MPKRVTREKFYTKRRRGRHEVRWLDDVPGDGDGRMERGSSR